MVVVVEGEQAKQEDSDEENKQQFVRRRTSSAKASWSSYVYTRNFSPTVQEQLLENAPKQSQSQFVTCFYLDFGRLNS